MGWEPRVATDAELDAMRAMTRQWMEAGAVGLNAGLDYQPGANSDTRELVELAKVVGEYGGVYAAHMRYSGVGIRDAFRETMRISAEAGIPVSVSHYQYEQGSREWIDEAEADGEADFSFESYMYPAGSTHFLMSLPLADQVGGPDALQERMRDPAYRDRIIAGLASQPRSARRRRTPGRGSPRPGPAASSARRSPRRPSRSASPCRSSSRILVEEELPDALLVYHRGFTDEEFEPTVRATIGHPRMLVASDGMAHGQQPHPRGAGTFARVLRYQVRERGHGLARDGDPQDERLRRRALPAARSRACCGRASAPTSSSSTRPRSATARRGPQPRLEPVGIDAVIVNGGSWPTTADGRARCRAGSSRRCAQ